MITVYPTATLGPGCTRRVTVTSDNGTLPNLTISDDDGNLYAAVSNGQTAVAVIVQPNARSKGGNRVRVVFPNAIGHPTNPSVLVEDYNPIGL